MTITPLQAMARAASTLVSDDDVTDVLAQLLTDAAESLDASAAGMLLLRPGGLLEVLTATSHRASDLELYQAQEQRGPCAEAATTDATVIGPDLASDPGAVAGPRPSHRGCGLCCGASASAALAWSGARRLQRVP